MLRRFDRTPVAEGKEVFQPEVDSHGTTRLWNQRLRVLNDREANPEVATAVTLDRDGLDLSLKRTGEDELEGVFADAEPVGLGRSRPSLSIGQFPSSLRQRERRILRPPLEARPAPVAVEEPLVR